MTVNFHKDLKRPLDENAALELKAKCSTEYNEILTNDYYASLRAAYTFKELKNFILENDLSSLDVFEEGENYLNSFDSSKSLCYELLSKSSL